MSINNPSKLVEEFKRSGEFDRIRRELLSQFQSGESLTAFKSRIEDVARQRLTSDHNLLYMPQEFIHRELMQELDRFPIVERSTSELAMFNDPALSTKIGSSLEKVLKDQGMIFKPKEESVKQTTVTKPPATSGENTGSPNGSAAPPTDENKPQKPDSHPPTLDSSNRSEESDKPRASTPIPTGKGEEGKSNKGPDSMDLDND